MAQAGDEDPKASLEKIKKQLNAGAGSVVLQGPLLKRSETLRKWNQRWFTLDPSTGKMEYRFQRGDASPRGLIYFDGDSTITVSPLNIQGTGSTMAVAFGHIRKAVLTSLFADIGTPQKKEFFLCAETPAAARAWVATLRAAALVLKAHKEAVNSLSGNGRAKLGTVAAVVAAANATARESMKDLQASFKPSVVAALQNSKPAGSESIDSSTVLKETLRVKDEELNQLQRDLRARDLTIKELAERLSETADAAESAASAVHSIDRERQVALSEVEHLKKELQRAAEQIKAAEERVVAANKTRDLALQEAHRWRVELGKAREQCVIMEAAVQRGHEHARQLKVAHEQELARLSQAEVSRAAGTPIIAEVQAEGPAVTGTATEKHTTVVIRPEPNLVSAPATSDLETAEDRRSQQQPLEVTPASPQLMFSEVEVVESSRNQDVPVELPQTPPPSQEGSNAPPSNEQSLSEGSPQDGAEHVNVEKSTEVVPPPLSDSQQSSIGSTTVQPKPILNGTGGKDRIAINFLARPTSQMVSLSCDHSEYSAALLDLFQVVCLIKSL